VRYLSLFSGVEAASLAHAAKTAADAAERAAIARATRPAPEPDPYPQLELVPA
jgi:hypothetical protein